MNILHLGKSLDLEVHNPESVGNQYSGDRQGCGPPIPTYPVIGNPYISPTWWVFMGYNPQESLENTINTTGTLLGVHLIVP